jgi:hypothetical protein
MAPDGITLGAAQTLAAHAAARPSNSVVPPDGCKAPSIFSSVDFPAPLSPTKRHFFLCQRERRPVQSVDRAI